LTACTLVAWLQASTSSAHASHHHLAVVAILKWENLQSNNAHQPTRQNVV
jgi:hypothetical protein